MVTIGTGRDDPRAWVQAAYLLLGAMQGGQAGAKPAAYHLTPANHGHLACETCGEITEIPGQLLDDLARTLRERYGFALSQHGFAITVN